MVQREIQQLLRLWTCPAPASPSPTSSRSHTLLPLPALSLILPRPLQQYMCGERQQGNQSQARSKGTHRRLSSQAALNRSPSPRSPLERTIYPTYSSHVHHQKLLDSCVCFTLRLNRTHPLFQKDLTNNFPLHAEVRPVFALNVVISAKEGVCCVVVELFQTYLTERYLYFIWLAVTCSDSCHFWRKVECYDIAILDSWICKEGWFGNRFGVGK